MIEAPVPAAGNPMEAPAPALPFAPGTSRPLSDEQVKQWQARHEKAEARMKLFHPQWERGLKRYAQALVPQRSAEINALLDYRHVESKKAQLFHRTPEVNLLPVDPQDQSIPYDQILPLREKFLNDDLGIDGCDMQRAVQKTLVDTLAASGYIITLLGYEVVTLPAPADPVTGQPAVPAVPIWAKRTIKAISSKKLLIPADFHDTDFDAAPWLTVKGVMPVVSMRRMGWQIPADFEGGARDESIFKPGGMEDEIAEGAAEYSITWYRASLFDQAVFHPELYRCLILVTGVDQPAWHVDSPFQTLTPEGQLTDDSMIGSPIHVDTIRDLIDSAQVPSDVVVGEQLSEEVNQFRTDNTRNRRSRRNRTLVSSAVPKDKVAEIIKNEGPIVVEENLIGENGSQRAMALVQGGTEPRDNYTAEEKAVHAYEEALGVSPNQAGAPNRTQKSATEIRTVAGNAQARAETDKDRVRRYVMKLVRKYDTIVQRTATPQELQKVLGQQGAALWEQWRALPGKYAYKIQPDAGQYVDVKEHRTQRLNEYNLLRKDPLVSAAELVKNTVRALGHDAGKMVPQDKVSEKPEAPKISIAFSAEQALLNPAEMELLVALLQQSGYQIPPDLVQRLNMIAQLRQAVAEATQPVDGNPQHKGAADRPEPLNKHQTQRTGGVQGVQAA